MLVFSSRLARTPCSLSTNFHGIISFTDAHLLNPVVLYRYENEHPARMRVPSDHRGTSLPPVSPLPAAFTRLPASVANKRLTRSLTLSMQRLHQTRGEEQVMVN